MEALEVQTPACKAIIQEGPRKGQPCQFPPLQNKYCGRHDRNRIYDEGIANGKIWCRFFFRGCDNIVPFNAKVKHTLWLNFGINH